MGEKDIQKSKALIKMSDNNFKTISKVHLNESTSSIIFTMLYECLRQILEAISLIEGYKIYSHEAYVAYLIKLNESSISEKFDRFRKLRNGVNYYGKPILKETTENAKQEITIIINDLVKKYLNNQIV